MLMQDGWRSARRVAQVKLARPKWPLVRPSSSAHLCTVSSKYMVRKKSGWQLRARSHGLKLFMSISDYLGTTDGIQGELQDLTTAAKLKEYVGYNRECPNSTDLLLDEPISGSIF